MAHWHTFSQNEVFTKLNASADGLTADEAADRVKQFGRNELIEKKKQSPQLMFLSQFSDFMILVLIAAAVISGFIGELVDTVIILVIVVLNAIVGFVQEYRAEKAMAALRKMAALHCVVLRDGVATDLPAADLVPGDVVLLEAGNAVPADIRLIESYSIRVDESTLTGESVPVDKTTVEVQDENASLGDRLNLVYKGTGITHGRGTGVVVETGMRTEIGKIASLLQEETGMTPLQKRMTDFGKKLSWLILSICLVLFGIGLLRGEDAMEMLLLSISLAVAAIPEALPALITIALARGAGRLVKQNALIRKLPAVETLGSVTFICSDKTGTLTVNRMKVIQTHSYHPDEKINGNISPLLAAMVLNNDVMTADDGSFNGDPTEMALVEHVVRASQTAGKLHQMYPRIAELPFDSSRKCMTTVHDYHGDKLVLIKGAVESVAERLNDPVAAKFALDLSQEWATNGLRVLAFGYRIVEQLPEPFADETIEKDFIFAGLAGMLDPAREEAKPAIDDCLTAGIRPVMITGDHPATAAAIARQLGILHENELVMTGKELLSMNEQTLAERAEKIRVYARVSPEQKLSIVKALQSRGHFVAMTGDGVNDAPSLKAADIGVAMGITGTDVSKEAAHMILLDDNFATIVKAIREGRRIYDNIRKFVKYIMTCNSAEIWTIFLAPLVGLPMPLLPIHILWINLVTDGLPGLALSGEKAENDIMNRAPRKTGESLFADGIAYHIVWVGILMAAVTLGTQAFAISNGYHWQTMVFTVLSFAQLGHVLAIRSDYDFLYRQGLFSNPQLLGAVALTFVLQLCVIYLPAANEIFRTEPLTWEELLMCIGISAIVFHAVELEKFVKMVRGRKNNNKRKQDVTR
jgi:Ca2+-transporting ATPase